MVLNRLFRWAWLWAKTDGAHSEVWRVETQRSRSQRYMSIEHRSSLDRDPPKVQTPLPPLPTQACFCCSSTALGKTARPPLRRFLTTRSGPGADTEWMDET
ncbi:hypothetical protein BZA05DRAFT_386182, partial [Tricharina praecox]|uniref:uncharacterized protein n=1 Tax=Tricharina praecox TaxID=43433 RepID=UPI00221EF89E